MTDLLNLIANEENHRIFVEHRFKDLVNLFDESYKLFLISADESREKYNSGLDQNYHAIYLFMSNKINSDMRTIYFCIRYGWYSTAHALIREINDALIKIIFITNFPEEIIKLRENKLKTKDIKKRLSEEHIKSPISDKSWGLLSQMKHADGKPIIGYFDFSANLNLLRFYPTINNFSIESLLIFASACLIRTCEHFVHFYKCKYGDTFKFPNYLIHFEKVRSKINKIIEQQNKELQSRKKL